MNPFRMISGGMLACMLLAFPGFAQERKVKSKDVPSAVLAASAKAFPKAEIRGWETEVKDGKTFYEVGVAEGAAKRQAVFQADGALVETEEIVAVSTVPAAVRDAVKQKYPKARIQEAEKITRGAETEFELGLKGAPVKAIILTPDGKILKEE